LQLETEKTAAEAGMLEAQQQATAAKVELQCAQAAMEAQLSEVRERGLVVIVVASDVGDY